MTEGTELDEIMSGVGDAMPETTDIQQQPEQTGQQRDEHGRFAAKAEEPAVVEPEQPAAIEPHAENGNKVPVGAVQEERQKRQQAQQEAETLRRELAELRGQVTLLTQQRQQPAQAQPQQEQQPATLWDDPDNYLKSQLTPVQQQMNDMREFMSENLAVQAYGAETVNAAKAAIEAAARTPEGQHAIQQMMQSRHPFDNLVKWHKRQQTLSQVGDDPQAWLQAELEKKMADPAFQAQVIERARNGAVQNTTRSQPNTSLPPSLSRIPTGGNQAEDGDMSDGALFSHALR
ncbi:hypothetical protein AU381_00090 [Sinorhizobium glycinis]|uniref:Uncharacterized protein n=1 Tax=Sinorhizobium glycinis TaxID=1472378 RepID=A0A178Y042_9HYPH|nr:hypothetical protein [Sinorhizobium glycinis]OAP40363.1 hypothetical protein AU381_00090 [Sinorhizobium glycinis]